MKSMIFAALAVLTLGLGVANAATTQNHAAPQQGNAYNFLEGGD